MADIGLLKVKLQVDTEEFDAYLQTRIDQLRAIEAQEAGVNMSAGQMVAGLAATAVASPRKVARRSLFAWFKRW